MVATNILCSLIHLISQADTKKIRKERKNLFNWGIQSFTVSSGEEIPLEQASTLIIVGPNSSGKSTALREIEILLYQTKNLQRPGPTVIYRVQSFLEGTQQDFRSWLQQNYLYPRDSYLSADYKAFAARDVIVSQGQISDLWKGFTEGSTIENASRFVCERLNAESRLELTKRKKSVYYYWNRPYEYIHILQVKASLLKLISEDLKKAFDVDLLINWGGGPEVWFHVGKEPHRSPDHDRVSIEYLHELNRLPPLEFAGDGIRSFVGTLLAARCGSHPVLLIDEPEAYLHPPQIRRLAAILAESAETMRRQVVIATHSSDVIRGALDGSNRVAVCRLTRHGDSNRAALLEREQIGKLLSKPLLRSGAAIDGVFHKGVVITESDSDSRIYEALVKRLENQRIINGPTDLYFIHGTGKGELAPLAAVYTRLKVPVAVIADFDLLQKQGDIEKVFSSLGGDFSEIRSLYNSTSSALNSLPPIKPTSEFLKEAQAILDEMKRCTPGSRDAEPRTTLMPEQRRKLSDLLIDSRDWSEPKKYGILKLTGGASLSCKQLLNECKRFGLFIVPTGELESWWREGPGKKEVWFLKAVEEIFSNDSSFREASDFMVEVWNHLYGRSVS